MPPDRSVKPLLTIKRAALLVMVSTVMNSAAGLIFNDEQGALVFCGYFVEHGILAIFVVMKARLRVRFPIDASWLDPLVVVCAAWFGPIAWYRLWKRTNTKPS